MVKKSLEINKFNRELEKFANKRVPILAKDVQKILTELIYRKILERTPVLTGRARRNWIPSFNSPVDFTTTKLAGVSETGTPETPQERARLRTITRNLQAGILGSTIFITNNLAYIGILERGNSAKAPNGIVEGAIQGALEELSSRGVKVQL